MKKSESSDQQIAFALKQGEAASLLRGSPQTNPPRI